MDVLTQGQDGDRTLLSDKTHATTANLAVYEAMKTESNESHWLLLLMSTEKIPIWHVFVLCFIPIWHLLLSPWSTTKSQVKASFCSTWLLGISAAPEKDKYRFFEYYGPHSEGTTQEFHESCPHRGHQAQHCPPGGASASRLNHPVQLHTWTSPQLPVCSLMPTWQIRLILFWGEIKLFKSQGKKKIRCGFLDKW